MCRFNRKSSGQKLKKSKSGSNPARLFRQPVRIPSVDLLNTLNEIAAKHGLGRTDLVEIASSE